MSDLKELQGFDVQPSLLNSHCQEGWSGGSRGDFEAIYTKRRLDLIRCLVGFGAKSHEAEELAQEVFLRLFKRIRSGQAPDDFFQWLRQSAKNLFIDRLRHNRFERLKSAGIWEDWETNVADISTDIEEELTIREQAHMIMEAISNLDYLERRCVLLRGKGATFREIAQALGIPMRRAVYQTGVAVRKLQCKLRTHNALVPLGK